MKAWHPVRSMQGMIQTALPYTLDGKFDVAINLAETVTSYLFLAHSMKVIISQQM